MCVKNLVAKPCLEVKKMAKFQRSMMNFQLGLNMLVNAEQFLIILSCVLNKSSTSDSSIST